MKKSFIVFYFLMFGVVICKCNIVFAQQVTIDYSNVIGTKPLIGANDTYEKLKILINQNQSNNFNTTYLNSLISSGIKVIRFPGGTASNTYRWKNALTPINARKKQVSGFSFTGDPWDASFGPFEAAKLAELVGAELIIVVPINDGAQNAADLVEFMNAKYNPNINNYATIRKNLGHELPFNVKYWEIGNESGGRELRTWTAWPKSGDNNRIPSPNAIGSAYPLDQSVDSVRTWWLLGGSRTFLNQKAVRDSTWGETGSNLPSDNLLKTTSNINIVDTFFVKFPPVNKISKLVINNQVWTETSKANLLTSSSTSRVFVLDKTTGMITFGGGVNGMKPTSNQYVFVDYVSGFHEGYTDFYKQMKLKDASIHITSSIYASIIRYSDVANNSADLDGYQVHTAGGSYNKLSLADSTSSKRSVIAFETLIARALVGMPRQLNSFLENPLKTNPIFNGKNLTLSEYSIGDDLYDRSIGATHSGTVKGALGNFFAVAQICNDYNVTTKNTVNVMTTNYVTNGFGILTASTSAVSGVGLSNKLLNYFLGNTVLKTNVNNMTSHAVQWNGLSSDMDKSYNVNVPDVITLSTKDSDGNLYVMMATTQDAVSKTVTVNVQNGFKLTEARNETWVLKSSGDQNSNNTSANQPISISQTASIVPISNTLFTVQIDPYTIKVVKFEVKSLTTSVRVNKESKLLLYPNPVKDYFTIETSKQIRSGEILLFNTNGQEVFRYEINGDLSAQKIDISGLNKGTYVIKVNGNNEILSGKIVKL